MTPTYVSAEELRALADLLDAINGLKQEMDKVAATASPHALASMGDVEIFVGEAYDKIGVAEDLDNEGYLLRLLAPS